jgi:putative SOS response-associated peptidase YedK
MCERIVQRRPASELASALYARLLDAHELPAPRFNIAPGAKLTVVRLSSSARERVADARQWGLVAPYFSAPEYGLRCGHARADTVNVKASFRGSFRKRRCIVPVDGFFAWRPSDVREPPHAFASRDGSPLLLAGLWSEWESSDAATQVHSCAVITTPANNRAARASRRMPAILSPEMLACWLGEQPASLIELQAMLRLAPLDHLRSWVVNDRVRDVTEQGPQLLDPLA